MSEQKPPVNPSPEYLPPPGDEMQYECIGICMADPVSGLCEGCGRPLSEPEPPEDAPDF